MHFAEFERKPREVNNLVLGLSETRQGKRLKIYIPENVVVPTNFLNQTGVEKINSVPGVRVKQNGRFYVASKEMPNYWLEIQELPDAFQKGSYDKFLRFSGLFVDREIGLVNGHLDDLLEGKEEAVLRFESPNALDNFWAGRFINEEDIENASTLEIDIEKPLYKTNEEKELLDERERIVKLERKYEKSKEHSIEETQKHLSRVARIGELERKLVIDVPGVGEVRLWEEKNDAIISYVIIKRKIPEKEILKELLLVDSNNECEKEEVNKYKITKYRDERALLEGLIGKLGGRKPLVSIGHNQVYDHTQINFAADENDLVYDLAIEDVRPRRDFVRYYLQRLRQETIYLDTLWISRILYPYLSQKRFDTSFKLGDVAKFLGFDFEKSMSHSELRLEELRRLYGQSKKIRQRSLDKMLEYATGDVDVTSGIFSRLGFLPLLVRMKKVMPYCTLSQIAFSINSTDRIWEFLHFKKNGNLPYYGYKQKEQEDKRAIFNKRYPQIKAGFAREVSLSSVKGNHDDVNQYYFSLEESLSEIGFELVPEMKKVYDWAKEQSSRGNGREILFGFLQYNRRFIDSLLVDWYFASRDREVYKYAREFISGQDLFAIPDKDLDSWLGIASCQDKGELSGLIGTFRFMKNHFRSIYAALEGKERADILPKKSNLRKIRFPGIAFNDSDLYLLRANHSKIKEQLGEGQGSVLKQFLGQFEKFDEKVEQIGRKLKSGRAKLPDIDMFDLLYTYIYRDRTESSSKRFLAKTGFRYQIQDVDRIINQAYERLRPISQKVVDLQGDYLFVKGKVDLPFLHHVREIGRYEVV